MQEDASAHPKAQPEHDDLPVEPAFASPCLPMDFWQDLVTMLIVGAFLGAFGVGYIRIVTDFPEVWTTTHGVPDFPSPQSLQFASGKPWWIGVGAACGLAVGLAKVILGLDDAPSFIEEIKSQHVDPLTSFKVTFCALLSLMGGVSLGPEAGLGAFGGAIGQLVATKVRRLPEMRRKLYVVASMAGAFAAFLPSPFTSVLLTTELGLPPNLWGISYVHMVTIYAAAAGAGFVVFYAIQGFTYLNPTNLYKAVASAAVYNQNYIFIGVLFGFMGVGLAISFFLIGGFVKTVTGKLRAKLEAKLGHKPTVIAMAIFGGTIYGVFMYVFPLTIGDGSAQLGTVLSQHAEIGSSVLAASAFAKMFTFHVCKECGFVGGIFFPCIIIGSMMGMVFVNITGVNPAVGVACSFIAMCSAFIPMPFFLIVLSISCLAVGSQMLIPVYATTLTAYLFCIGVGIPQAMIKLSNKKTQQNEAPSEAPATAVVGA